MARYIAKKFFVYDGEQLQRGAVWTPKGLHTDRAIINNMVIEEDVPGDEATQHAPEPVDEPSEAVVTNDPSLKPPTTEATPVTLPTLTSVTAPGRRSRARE